MVGRFGRRLPGSQHQQAVVAADGGRGDALGDSEREYQALVVVRVLAHQVRPAGGAPDAGAFPDRGQLVHLVRSRRHGRVHSWLLAAVHSISSNAVPVSGRPRTISGSLRRCRSRSPARCPRWWRRRDVQAEAGLLADDGAVAFHGPLLVRAAAAGPQFDLGAGGGLVVVDVEALGGAHGAQLAGGGGRPFLVDAAVAAPDLLAGAGEEGVAAGGVDAVAGLGADEFAGAAGAGGGDGGDEGDAAGLDGGGEGAGGGAVGGAAPQVGDVGRPGEPELGEGDAEAVAGGGVGVEDADVPGAVLLALVEDLLVAAVDDPVSRGCRPGRPRSPRCSSAGPGHRSRGWSGRRRGAAARWPATTATAASAVPGR